MTEKNLSTLKIHKLTQDQYNIALSKGNIEEDALYLTHDEEIDLSPYATVDDMNKKANNSDLTAHTGNKTNPHGVTKDQVGLSNVPNVSTNDQTPTYSNTTTFATLSSGEKLSVAFAKIKLAITNLINHINNTENPHSVTKAQIGLGNVNNTSDANKPISTATQTALNGKADVGHTHTIDSELSTTSANPVQNKVVATKVNSFQTSVDSKVPSTRKVNGKALSADITLSSSDIGADASGTADSKVNAHNTSTAAHNDIRTLISGLEDRLTALADSDDTTLDQLSEIVAYVKSNRSLIESVTTTKINVADIVNNLTTNVKTKVLGADQGVVLKGLIDDLRTSLTSHTHTIANVTGLQSALDGKAASSHGTHVSYSTTAPVMDGTAAVGTATTVARSDHKHPTDTSRASQTDLDTLKTTVNGKANSSHTHKIADVTNLQSTLDAKATSSALTSHTGNTTVHITADERTSWNNAKTHASSAHAPSNAQANQNAFSNVKVGTTTVAADTPTDTLELVAGANVTLTPDATNDKITISSKDTVYSHPNSGVTAGTYKSVSVNAQGHVTGGTNPTTLAGYGITDAAAKSHTHDYLPLSGGTLTGNLTGKYITGTWLQTTAISDKTGDIVTVDSDGWLYKRTKAEILSDIGAAANSHNHNDTYYTESEIDSKVSSLNSSISSKMDLTSAQTASGVKTFSNGINIGSANLKYDSSAGALTISFS